MDSKNCPPSNHCIRSAKSNGPLRADGTSPSLSPLVPVSPSVDRTRFVPTTSPRWTLFLPNIPALQTQSTSLLVGAPLGNQPFYGLNALKVLRRLVPRAHIAPLMPSTWFVLGEGP